MREVVQDFVGMMHYMDGEVFLQLAFRTEAPCHAYGCDAGAVGGLHINSGVAYVYHFILGRGAFPEYAEHNRGVGLCRNALLLTLDGVSILL